MVFADPSRVSRLKFVTHLRGSISQICSDALSPSGASLRQVSPEVCGLCWLCPHWSLGLKEQWQADVGQQASTWVALMPEAPGGSRQQYSPLSLQVATNQPVGVWLVTVCAPVALLPFLLHLTLHACILFPAAASLPLTALLSAPSPLPYPPPHFPPNPPSPPFHPAALEPSYMAPSYLPDLAASGVSLVLLAIPCALTAALCLCLAGGGEGRGVNTNAPSRFSPVAVQGRTREAARRAAGRSHLVVLQLPWCFFNCHLLSRHQLSTFLHALSLACHLVCSQCLGWYPSQVQVSLSGAGIPLRCRYPSQVQVSLSGAGIPLRCRYPSQVQVSLSGAGIPLRCSGPFFLPPCMALTALSLVLGAFPCNPTHHCSLCALLEGRGVGSTPTLPLTSPLWPCRDGRETALQYIGIAAMRESMGLGMASQAEMSGGDGREAALQRIAIAATRESMGMGVASQDEPFACSSALHSRSAGTVPCSLRPSHRLPRSAQCNRGCSREEGGSRRVAAGGQQEGSRRATGGQQEGEYGFLSSFLFPRISSPFTPPSSSPPPPSLVPSSLCPTLQPSHPSRSLTREWQWRGTWSAQAAAALHPTFTQLSPCRALPLPVLPLELVCFPSEAEPVTPSPLVFPIACCASALLLHPSPLHQSLTLSPWAIAGGGEGRGCQRRHSCTPLLWWFVGTHGDGEEAALQRTQMQLSRAHLSLAAAALTCSPLPCCSSSHVLTSPLLQQLSRAHLSLAAAALTCSPLPCCSSSHVLTSPLLQQLSRAHLSLAAAALTCSPLPCCSSSHVLTSPLLQQLSRAHLSLAAAALTCSPLPCCSSSHVLTSPLLQQLSRAHLSLAAAALTCSPLPCCSSSHVLTSPLLQQLSRAHLSLAAAALTCSPLPCCSSSHVLTSPLLQQLSRAHLSLAAAALTCSPLPCCSSSHVLTSPLLQQLSRAHLSLAAAALTCSPLPCCSSSHVLTSPLLQQLSRAHLSLAAAALTCSPLPCCSSSHVLTSPLLQQLSRAHLSLAAAALTCSPLPCCSSSHVLTSPLLQQLSRAHLSLAAAALTCSPLPCCSSSHVLTSPLLQQLSRAHLSRALPHALAHLSPSQLKVRYLSP
ncbi:unnamed protein product [Closterium sp. NIES-65]|nr:unnamed protein product [Closterium sp. NIES-65]